MRSLAVANLLHHKLRSALSALGVAIAVSMLVTLTGLARGTLFEIADRWEGVKADLIAYPAVWGENVATLSGVGIADKEGPLLMEQHPRLVQQVVPVFLWPMKIADQDHAAAGVDAAPEQWKTLTGGRGLLEGRWCDADGRAADWLVKLKLHGTDDGAEPTEDYLRAGLSQRGGFEIVIDRRLAQAAGLALGQSIEAAGHEWRIVGIAPEGVLSRAFIPRRSAQFLFGAGNVRMSTLLFVKLHAGADDLSAARAIRTPWMQAVPVRQYRQMLRQRFGIMFLYIHAVNAVAMIIALLFVLVTLYTTVLQRTRDIAILKSCGASRAFIMRQVLAEALLLTGAGAVAGIGLSFLGAAAIARAAPLLTVRIEPAWVAVSVALAACGAIASGLYPAWRASKVDVAEALTTE